MNMYWLVRVLICDEAVTTALLILGICPDSTVKPCMKRRSMEKTEKEKYDRR
jgi:hypothetical protein